MKRSSVGHLPCTVARSLDVVGEWWTLLVLRDVFYGLRRFDEIRDNLGISRNILADRLSTLVENDVLARRRYSDHPPRFEYTLTPKGSELASVLLALMRWGDKWLTTPSEGQFAVAVHKDCGHQVYTELRCEQCGTIDSDRARLRPGPSARWTRPDDRQAAGARLFDRT